MGDFTSGLCIICMSLRRAGWTIWGAALGESIPWRLCRPGRNLRL